MSQTMTTIEHEIGDLGPNFAAVLPPDVSLERFHTVVLAAIRAKPDLLRCDRQSLFNACLNAAQDGLLPDGREGAIIPRKGRATWQPMIHGLYKRVKTSGSVSTLSANVVYDGEEFAVLLGDEERIVHRRGLDKVQPGQEIAVYAIATLKDGSKEREVMTWDEVMVVRQSSTTPNDGPWVTQPGEMARKTVVRRLAKRLPVMDKADERLHSAINRVDALYNFGTPAPDAPALPPPPPPTRTIATQPPAQRRTGPQPGWKESNAPSWREVIAGLTIDFNAAPDLAAVNAILARADVVKAKQLFKGTAAAALDKLIAKAVAAHGRTDEPDTADDQPDDPLPPAGTPEREWYDIAQDLEQVETLQSHTRLVLAHSARILGWKATHPQLHDAAHAAFESKLQFLRATA